MDEKDPKRIIEAALFMSSKALTMADLAKIAGIGAVGFVKDQIEMLKREYEERGSAVRIYEEPEGYMMRLLPEYEQVVGQLAKEADISKQALKVLAVVSKNEGMEQSRLVTIVGSSTYDGVHELEAKGFINSHKKGRTKVLKTSKKFKEYFNE
ncbi:MAG: SMC-Scp complex subunit ScpB [Candidatus Micrarchaeota archaeon]